MGSNCTYIDDLLEIYYLSPFYAIEFAVGFPSNLLVILGYLFCLPKWQSINVYLFNLAVSDLIFLCTLPRLSYLYGSHHPGVSRALCILNRYILHVNLYSSILFMVWVSFDRYLLIRYPARNHFLLSRWASLLVSGLSWLAVNIQVAPLMGLLIQDHDHNNGSACKDFGSLQPGSGVLAYSLVLTLTGYLLPLLGLCLSSLHIARLLRVQQGAFQGRHNASYRGPLRVVIAAAIMFLVLYTPYHIMRNVRIVSRLPSVGLAMCPRIYVEAGYILTRPLAFIHSVINPVFYFLMGDKFRELLLAKLQDLRRRVRQGWGRYRVG